MQDLTEEKFDRILQRLEADFNGMANNRTSLVKLSVFETSFMTGMENARDFIISLLHRDNTRQRLIQIFGGTCVRTARLQNLIEVVEFSDMYKNDQRHPLCQKAIRSLVQVLEDLGQGAALKKATESDMSTRCMSARFTFIGGLVMKMNLLGKRQEVHELVEPTEGWAESFKFEGETLFGSMHGVDVILPTLKGKPVLLLEAAAEPQTHSIHDLVCNTIRASPTAFESPLTDDGLRRPDPSDPPGEPLGLQPGSPLWPDPSDAPGEPLHVVQFGEARAPTAWQPDKVRASPTAFESPLTDDGPEPESPVYAPRWRGEVSLADTADGATTPEFAPSWGGIPQHPAPSHGPSGEPRRSLGPGADPLGPGNGPGGPPGPGNGPPCKPTPALATSVEDAREWLRQARRAVPMVTETPQPPVAAVPEHVIGDQQYAVTIKPSPPSAHAQKRGSGCATDPELWEMREKGHWEHLPGQTKLQWHDGSRALPPGARVREIRQLSPEEAAKLTRLHASPDEWRYVHDGFEKVRIS